MSLYCLFLIPPHCILENGNTEHVYSSQVRIRNTCIHPKWEYGAHVFIPSWNYGVRVFIPSENTEQVCSSQVGIRSTCVHPKWEYGAHVFIPVFSDVHRARAFIPVFRGVRIAHSSVFCVVFCQSLFVLLSFVFDHCSVRSFVTYGLPLLVI